jgi:protocatechuate 3,4-dioxygenase beta subunit
MAAAGGGSERIRTLDGVGASAPDENARRRMVSQFDLALTEPEWALGYRWDIVLSGREATPFEESK